MVLICTYTKGCIPVKTSRIQRTIMCIYRIIVLYYRRQRSGLTVVRSPVPHQLSYLSARVPRGAVVVLEPSRLHTGIVASTFAQEGTLRKTISCFIYSRSALRSHHKVHYKVQFINSMIVGLFSSVLPWIFMKK